MPTYTLITAVSAIGNIIGNQGELPWHLPYDLKRFKQLSSGKYILMGRKTYESIGRPLPERKNIVLTRDNNFKTPKKVMLINNIEQLQGIDKDIMVIGGAEVYQQFLPLADKIYLTMVFGKVKGDTAFHFSFNGWDCTPRETHYKIDEPEHSHDYAFMTLTRKKEDASYCKLGGISCRYKAAHANNC